MMIISKSSPEGNVFNIISKVAKLVFQTVEQRNEFLNEMLQFGSYDLILNEIEKRYPTVVHFID